MKIFLPGTILEEVCRKLTTLRPMITRLLRLFRKAVFSFLTNFKVFKRSIKNLHKWVPNQLNKLIAGYASGKIYLFDTEKSDAAK